MSLILRDNHNPHLAVVMTYVMKAIFFMFGSKINEFRRVWTEKIGIWRKKFFYEKILEFFSKTFCLFDLYCQANFWTQNLKQRPIKKRPPLKAALDLWFFIRICQRFLKLLRLSWARPFRVSHQLSRGVHPLSSKSKVWSKSVVILCNIHTKCCGF